MCKTYFLSQSWEWRRTKSFRRSTNPWLQGIRWCRQPQKPVNFICSGRACKWQTQTRAGPDRSSLCGRLAGPSWGSARLNRRSGWWQRVGGCYIRGGAAWEAAAAWGQRRHHITAVRQPPCTVRHVEHGAASSGLRNAHSNLTDSRSPGQPACRGQHLCFSLCLTHTPPPPHLATSVSSPSFFLFVIQSVSFMFLCETSWNISQKQNNFDLSLKTGLFVYFCCFCFFNNRLVIFSDSKMFAPIC